LPLNAHGLAPDWNPSKIPQGGKKEIKRKERRGKGIKNVRAFAMKELLASLGKGGKKRKRGGKKKGGGKGKDKSPTLPEILR